MFLALNTPLDNRGTSLNLPKLLTLCVVGADAAVTAQIHALLDEVRSQLDARWKSAEQADADLLLIDAESVYGHMDWLRARSTGRLAAALTKSPEAHDNELHLRMPLASGELVALCNRVGAALPGKPQPAPAPTPIRRMPEHSAAAKPVASPPVVAPAPAPQALRIDDLLETEPPLAGCLRLSAEGLPTLLLDPRERVWRAASTLKAMSGWSTRTLLPADVHALDEREFAAAAEGLPSHPYARLRWLAHLVRGAGQLEGGLDAGARYKLSRWPQSEREFPKHFRIATVMLKQAATIDEIAGQSGATAADVADFINAYHAIGFVEHDAPEKPAEEAKRAGLFGRAKKTSTIS